MYTHRWPRVVRRVPVLRLLISLTDLKSHPKPSAEDSGLHLKSGVYSAHMKGGPDCSLQGCRAAHRLAHALSATAAETRTSQVVRGCYPCATRRNKAPKGLSTIDAKYVFIQSSLATIPSDGRLKNKIKTPFYIYRGDYEGQGKMKDAFK